MHAEAKASGLSRGLHRFFRAAPGHQHRGAGDDAFMVCAEDSSVDAWVEAEIIGVHHQPFRLSHLFTPNRRGDLIAFTSGGSRTGRAGSPGASVSVRSDTSSFNIFTITCGEASVLTPRVRGK